jgi:MFS transporter, FSR family, fosmidomycin resistance protein
MTEIIVPPQSTLKRDSLIISLISSSHFFSHFYQLTLASLFPLLHDAFKVDYVVLGSVVACFYTVSGVCQTFAGVLVDKHGSRPILTAGIGLMAVCVLLAGFVPQFWMLYPLFIIAGFGNSIFHPADFSALSHYVSVPRHGRAFSVHAFAGSLGYAAAPVIVGTLGVTLGWRAGLIVAGGLGLGMTFLLYRYGHRFLPDYHEEHATAPVKFSYLEILAMPSIILSFGYLLFTSSATGAIQTLSSVAFIDFYHVPLARAATAVSAYIFCSATGMLIGGFIADHTKHHARAAAIGLASSAFFAAIIATGVGSFTLVTILLACAGLCQGTTAPSRDVLVKSSAPPGSIGRVFGIVYSGGDAALALAPLIFGMLADHHAYHAFFFGVAALYLVGICTVMTIQKEKNKAVI